MLELVNINKGLEEYRNTEEALLVDVREKNEYSRGHIPGAVNEPLSVITRTTLSKDRPLFLYCLRGSRSCRRSSTCARAGCHRQHHAGHQQSNGFLFHNKSSLIL